MTSIDGDLLDRLEVALLDHRGADNAIAAADLAEKADIDDGKGNAKTREAKNVLIEERQIPVATNHNGIFVAETLGEFEDYVENLNTRIAGIEGLKQDFARAWNHRQKQAREQAARKVNV